MHPSHNQACCCGCCCYRASSSSTVVCIRAHRLLSLPRPPSTSNPFVGLSCLNVRVCVCLDMYAQLSGQKNRAAAAASQLACLLPWLILDELCCSCWEKKEREREEAGSSEVGSFKRVRERERSRAACFPACLPGSVACLGLEWETEMRASSPKRWEEKKSARPACSCFGRKIHPPLLPGPGTRDSHARRDREKNETWKPVFGERRIATPKPRRISPLFFPEAAAATDWASREREKDVCVGAYECVGLAWPGWLSCRKVSCCCCCCCSLALLVGWLAGACVVEKFRSWLSWVSQLCGAVLGVHTSLRVVSVSASLTTTRKKKREKKKKKKGEVNSLSSCCLLLAAAAAALHSRKKRREEESELYAERRRRRRRNS